MMKKKYILMLASCLFLIVAGVCYSCSYSRSNEKGVVLTSLDSELADEIVPIEPKGDTIEIEEVPMMIYVHLCGAVVYPDVYQVEAGARLVDIIGIAGGLIPEAAADYINQAIEVEDGQRIYIPTRDELDEITLDEYVKGDNNSLQTIIQDKADNRVNINTADEAELMSLPGIGQAKAKSILEYRKNNGDFKDTSDLMKISGIKDGLYDPIADMITVN